MLASELNVERTSESPKNSKLSTHDGQDSRITAATCSDNEGTVLLILFRSFTLLFLHRNLMYLCKCLGIFRLFSILEMSRIYLFTYLDLFYSRTPIIRHSVEGPKSDNRKVA